AVRRAGPVDAVPVAGYGAPVRMGKPQPAAVLATVRIAAAGRLAHCARPRRGLALSGTGVAGRRRRDCRLVPELAAGTTATPRALDRTALADPRRRCRPPGEAPTRHTLIRCRTRSRGSRRTSPAAPQH